MKQDNVLQKYEEKGALPILDVIIGGVSSCMNFLRWLVTPFP